MPKAKRTKAKTPAGKLAAAKAAAKRTKAKTATAAAAKAKAKPTVVKAVKRGAVKKNPATAHHAVMVDPFSNATAQPKIPDGLVPSSLSRRMQRVLEIKNEVTSDGAFGANDVDIVIVPSLGIAAAVFGATPKATAARDYIPIGFAGQSVGFNCETFPSNNSNNSVVKNETGIANWRIVSQGLKVKLNNTQEENDGWFEACRFNFSMNAGDWSLVNTDNANARDSMGLCPDVDFKSRVIDNLKASMVEQPGYHTGLLKDIEKTQFNLNSKTPRANFKSLDESYYLKSHSGSPPGTGNIAGAVGWEENAYAVFEPGTGAIEWPNDGRNRPEAMRFLKDCIDENYDAILITCHCRTNAGSTSSSNGSKLILNAIQNVEFCFKPESDLTTFQTPNKSDRVTPILLETMNDHHGFATVQSEHMEQAHEPMELVNMLKRPRDDEVVVAQPEEVQQFEHYSEIGKLGVATAEHREYWTNFFERSSMETFLADAYKNPLGYAIRTNPVTGKKEMMVAGTRSRGGDMSSRDWIQNVVEAGHKVAGHFGELGEKLDVVGNYSVMKRDQGSDRLSVIAEQMDVDVVYGHSRGAAVMSGMHGSFDSVGIDGAAFIGHDKPYTNVVMKYNAFDRLIAFGHKGNLGVTDRGFHNVTTRKKRRKKNTERKSPTTTVGFPRSEEDNKKRRFGTIVTIRKVDKKKKKKKKKEKESSRR